MEQTMSAQDGALSWEDLMGMTQAWPRHTAPARAARQLLAHRSGECETCAAWDSAEHNARRAEVAEAHLVSLRAEHDALLAHWCKDGETLAERLQRERDDSLALMGLLAQEKQRAQDAEDRHAEVLAAVREFLAAHASHVNPWEPSKRDRDIDAAHAKFRALVAAQGDEGGER
jgi:hypothetical protein